MQIKPKLIETGDMTGEFDITDYCLGFNAHGPLCYLNVHWEAIVHFCKTLDAAQYNAKRAIAASLARTPKEDPETLLFLTSELESASVAEETLVKATIFIVLCSFKEFALKELYRQLKDEDSLPTKSTFNHIKRVFAKRDIWPNDEHLNTQLSETTYDSIRNNFAHGDWAALKENLPKLELHDVFGELAGFVHEIGDRMRGKGMDV